MLSGRSQSEGAALPDDCQQRDEDKNEDAAPSLEPEDADQERKRRVKAIKENNEKTKA